MSYSRELKAAVKASKMAGRRQMKNYGKRILFSRKEDASPVTDVDRECEDILKDILLGSFPDDGFEGEESGYIKGNNNRKWVVDPLDGTRPYIRKIPTFSVLVSLLVDGVPVAGVIHLPAMGETYTAALNEGAELNGEEIRVSSCADLSEATGSALGFIEKADTAEGKNLFSLMRKWDYAYGFMDAYSYGCMAAGRLDASVNLLDKPWDCAAAACIIKEAGGRYSDIKGEETVESGNIVLSNGLLHDKILSCFNKS